jgi:hypothetical protein
MKKSWWQEIAIPHTRISSTTMSPIAGGLWETPMPTVVKI